MKNKQILTSPTALLSADEINYGGVRWSTGSLNSYIMDNANSGWWTFSPYYIAGSSPRAFNVGLSGSLGNNLVNRTSSVRPVVSLKSEVVCSGGDGRKLNPYTLSNPAS